MARNASGQFSRECSGKVRQTVKRETRTLDEQIACAEYRIAQRQAAVAQCELFAARSDYDLRAAKSALEFAQEWLAGLLAERAA